MRRKPNGWLLLCVGVTFIYLLTILISGMTGCAARPASASIPTGTAVPVSASAYRATITNAPLQLSSLTVNGTALFACTDALAPPCFQQVGSTVRINGVAHEREREDGKIVVALKDNKGRETGAVVPITGWGRHANH